METEATHLLLSMIFGAVSVVGWKLMTIISQLEVLIGLLRARRER